MLQGGHFQRIPKVETLDNIIKNMQNLVQGKNITSGSLLGHFRFNLSNFRLTSGLILLPVFRYWTKSTVCPIYAITSFP